MELKIRASHLLAKAAEGAGGGVFLVGTLEQEPLLSEADKDIIRLDERTIMDYECAVVVDACPVEYARTFE